MDRRRNGQAIAFAVATVAIFGLGCGPDTTWRPAFDASERGWVMNVFGLSADSLYAVGGSPDRGRITRFDGQTATDETIPDVPLVNWTYGFAADDFHAVGNEGTVLRNTGDEWVELTSPTDQDLWGVWGAAPDDVWAVGGSARLPTGEPTLIHFDGESWSTVEVPPLTPSNVLALFKVWGSSADNVYAVGDVGVVIHYDGETWEEIAVGAPDDLVAIWGTGPDDIVAVGGRSNGVVAHFDGTEWHADFVTPFPGLNGVWMREPGIAHVAGLRGTLAIFDTSTMELTPVPVDEALDFHAIYGVDGTLTAVGGNLASPGSATGTAWRRELAEGE